MSKKPVRKHIIGLGDVIDYSQMDTYKEASMAAPRPEVHVAGEGAPMHVVGDEYHTRQATPDELKNATAAVLANRGIIVTAKKAMTRQELIASVTKAVKDTSGDDTEKVVDEGDLDKEDLEEITSAESLDKEMEEAVSEDDKDIPPVKLKKNPGKPSDHSAVSKDDPGKPSMPKKLKKSDVVFVPEMKSNVVVTRVFKSGNIEVANKGTLTIMSASAVMPEMKSGMVAEDGEEMPGAEAEMTEAQKKQVKRQKKEPYRQ